MLRGMSPSCCEDDAFPCTCAEQLAGDGQGMMDTCPGETWEGCCKAEGAGKQPHEAGSQSVWQRSGAARIYISWTVWPVCCGLMLFLQSMTKERAAICQGTGPEQLRPLQKCWEIDKLRHTQELPQERGTMGDWGHGTPIAQAAEEGENRLLLEGLPLPRSSCRVWRRLGSPRRQGGMKDGAQDPLSLDLAGCHGLAGAFHSGPRWLQTSGSWKPFHLRAAQEWPVLSFLKTPPET